MTAPRVAVALLTLMLCGISACSSPPTDLPRPGQGTGNAGQPTAGASVGVTTPAPPGGAAARIGDVEETIGTVACTVLDGRWTMSGGDEEGAKVAVTATEDRTTVLTASVVLSDGTVASVDGSKGQADIVWEQNTFTVTGTGTLIDLNAAEEPVDDPEVAFAISASCPS